MKKSNLHDITRGVKTTDLNNTSLFPQYGNVVVKHIPKNHVVIIDDESVEIIHKSKVIKTDDDMIIYAGGSGNVDGAEVEGVLSLDKLSKYLMSRLGNFGEGLFLDFEARAQAGEFTYKHFKVAKDS